MMSHRRCVSVCLKVKKAMHCSLCWVLDKVILRGNL
uniref:Uncharacterized protein n=1 Tax=Anguilla anguilla TaxID=7936 RepID=A0A0E9VLT1_ANGAN